jgi:hypothetical protein
MFLTDDDIHEFIRLYREEFGEILSFGDARIRAEEVLRLIEMLSRIDPELQTEEDD